MRAGGVFKNTVGFLKRNILWWIVIMSCFMML